MKIEKVIAGNFCIGCGACAAKSDAFEIKENNLGLYQARIISTPSEDVSEICPFGSSKNEDDIAKKIFEENSNYDSKIGYYKKIFAGSVAEGNYRTNGSSGGLTTWVLSQLFLTEEIDAVVHVGATSESNALFNYRVSENLDEIQENSKTRYYPVHMADVLKIIKKSNKRYAIVGVPCFIKAIRLLALEDAQFSARIKYCIAIFCGHFKSKFFSEMIGWQLGIHPSELMQISFREKEKTRRADQYSVRVWSKNSEKKQPFCSPSKPANALYGMDWGLGYFKPNACDWCDDIAGETADLACGDAWLPEFTSEANGTNIAIARNEKILQILESGAKTGALNLHPQSVEKVHQSQAANYRHRREGLAVRIMRARDLDQWHPQKREEKNNPTLSIQREKIYLLRSEISSHSLSAFASTKARGAGFLSFAFSMLPLELKYYRLNRKFLKGAAKTTLSLVRYLIQRK